MDLSCPIKELILNVVHIGYHPPIYFYMVEVCWYLISSSIGREVGYDLDRFLVHYEALQRHNYAHTHTPKAVWRNNLKWKKSDASKRANSMTKEPVRI